MAEPLTKEERELARSYAEMVYADTTDPQKHTTAVMILRLLDTVAALEADNARLRQLAEVGEAAMRYATARRALRESNEGIGVLDRLHNMDAAFNELLDAALRGAKGEW